MMEYTANDLVEYFVMKRKTFDQWVQRGIIDPPRRAWGAGYSSKYDKRTILQILIIQALRWYHFPLRTAGDLARCITRERDSIAENEVITVYGTVSFSIGVFTRDEPCVPTYFSTHLPHQYIVIGNLRCLLEAAEWHINKSKEEEAYENRS